MCFGQAINSCRQDALNRIRYRYIRLEIPVLDDGTSEFLQEEGIAFRFLNNKLFYMRRKCRVVTGGVHHGHTVVPGQTAQGELCRIGFLDPQGAIARTVSGQQENGSPWQTLNERCQVILGRGVDPMHVLDLDNQWPLLTALETHLLECVEGARPHRFWR